VDYLFLSLDYNIIIPQIWEKSSSNVAQSFGAEIVEIVQQI
jgi:hypothetical protein